MKHEKYVGGAWFCASVVDWMLICGGVAFTAHGLNLKHLLTVRSIRSL